VPAQFRQGVFADPPINKTAAPGHEPSVTAFEAVEGGSDPSCGERFGCASVISPKTNQQTLCLAHHLGFAVGAWRFVIDKFFGKLKWNI
jgi:hypothetical protein